MKKIKISLIIVIAVVGAILIYKKFEHIDTEQKEIDKFVSEYTLLTENHVFQIIKQELYYFVTLDQIGANTMLKY